MDTDDLPSELAFALVDFQNELLKYEASLRYTRGDALRNSFMLLMRQAHSIKGLFGLAERPGSIKLVHTLESLLSAHQTSGEPLDRVSLDLGFDCIDALVATLESPREDPSRLGMMTQRVSAQLEESRLANSLLRPFPFPLSPSEAKRIAAAKDQGQHIYCVEKVIRTDITKSVFDTLPIREVIAQFGELIAVYPSYQNLSRSHSEAVLTFAAVTARTKEELELEIFDSIYYCSWPSGPSMRAQPAPKPPLVSSSPEAIGPLRILIAEDDATSRMLLGELLSAYGICHAACNGNEAVVLFRRALSEGMPYRLVCLDIMMPEMDGHAALLAIRGLEGEYGSDASQRTKIVMTTALSGYEHFHRAFVNECDAYLVKPVTKTALVRQMQRLEFAPIHAP